MTERQTQGEYIVGVDFNPSRDGRVDQIKRVSAQLIDLIHGIQDLTDVDGDAAFNRAFQRGRLIEMAVEHVEIAAMLAVKAATKPLPKE